MPSAAHPPTPPKTNRNSNPAFWRAAFHKTRRQFGNMLPLLAGVILLVGLFSAFVPAAALQRVFTGHPALDALLGTLVGSATTGNAVNSYVIGRKLLADGVGVYAVAAFVFAWATVGVIQLPAEMGMLGRRFALARLAATVIICLLVAFLTGALLNALDLVPAVATNGP
jgi:uncharacterized membrane protein YraQ (UPF0718 family)